MKFQQRRFLLQKEKPKPLVNSVKSALPQEEAISLIQKFKSIEITDRMDSILQRTGLFLYDIKSIGSTKNMDDYDRRKLSIFNQINFYQLLAGLLIPIVCVCVNQNFYVTDFFIASLPAFISFLALILNFYFKYEAGLICYFILAPFVTSIVYLNGMSLGTELFFILYAVLSVFFLQEISQMLFSMGLSMTSYFMLSMVSNHSRFQLQTASPFLYLLNQLIAIGFILYGLYLIKYENSGYHFSILTKNDALYKKNLEIEQQKEEIAEKAGLLKRQTSELTELNSLKNKLFSVIAHDLKSPIYALRTLFSNMHQLNTRATEIKSLIPDVVKDLTYTTGLIENLLQWAKIQMQDGAVKMQTFSLSSLTCEVVDLLRLQAEIKQVSIENRIGSDCMVVTDREMLNLVLRNLLSNAIKFTPQDGLVAIAVKETASYAEVFVEDSGIGISPDALQKISENDYYSTKGTSSESGTGLGLMLCKEFLTRNGIDMQIRSETGKGSIFSFKLPKPE